MMNETAAASCKENNVTGVLITEQEIKDKIAEYAAIIDREYEGKPLIVVSILNGAFVFCADLCRALTIPCEIGFMAARSYSGTESTGNVEIVLDLKQDISNYHVLIAEDIIDSGRTLSEVSKMLKARNPLSFKVITLLDKPSRRAVDFKADYTLFTIPDRFIVGYGLDYNEQYRGLPYIGVID